MIIINPKYIADLENKNIRDVKGVTSLSLHNKQLKGSVFVQEFPNLESLDLDWNYIDSFDIDSSSSYKLKKLNLGGNCFKDLDDCLNNVDLKKLTHLSLNDNYLINMKLDYFIGCKFIELNLGNRNDNKRKLKNFISDKNDSIISQIAENLNLDNTDFYNECLEESSNYEESFSHQGFKNSPQFYDEKELICNYSIILIFFNFFKLVFEKIKNIAFEFKLIIEVFSCSFDDIRNYNGLKRMFFFVFFYFVPLSFFLFFNIFKKLKIETIKDKKKINMKKIFIWWLNRG